MAVNSYFTTARAWLVQRHEQHPRVVIAAAAALCLLLLAGLSVVLLIVAVYFGAFGPLPSTASVASVETPEASWLLDRQGRALSRYYAENREVADIDELPPILIEALLATEDARFFQHSGIDWQATARAVVYSGLLGQGEQGGGSTLSQQLAKNHFPRRRGGKFALLVSKIKEAFTANRFEKAYTKEELIALYLNTVPFGEDLYGVKVAARRFFDAELLDLKTEEAAVLVGMLKANSAYSPVRHPVAARERRNTVLRRLAQQSFISVAEQDSLAALPLTLHERRDRAQASTSYFSERIRGDINEILAKTEGPTGLPYDLRTSGLRVHTTLDADAQAMAEAALQSHLADLQLKFSAHWADRDPDGFEPLLTQAVEQSHRYGHLIARGKTPSDARASFGESRTITYIPTAAAGAGERTGTWRDSVRAELLRLRAGLVVADPYSEEILAYVGGADFEAVPFNSAVARRQVGSTFKPIVYAAAVEQGASPCDYFPNEQRTYVDYDNWTPSNADGQYGGEYSLTGALVNSVNTVAVQLAFSVTPKRIVELAERMGLTGVPDAPSIALGTPSLSLEDMVRVYGTFARGGSVPYYQMITRIETRGGELVYEAAPKPERERVFSRHTAETMDYMLRQVAQRGTGSGLASRYGVRSEVAGKTGTTQDQADGWFMGYTRTLVVGAWVGGQYPSIRWRSLFEGQGARTALPIVGKFLRSYEQANGSTQLPPVAEDVELDAYCEDFIDYGEGYDQGHDYEPGDIERVFEQIFGNGRPADKQREHEEEQRRERAQQQREQGRANNIEAARRQRERLENTQSRREQSQRESKRDARQARRKKAFDQIFKPD